MKDPKKTLWDCGKRCEGVVKDTKIMGVMVDYETGAAGYLFLLTQNGIGARRNASYCGCIPRTEQ
jgi:hypothetical protein